VAKEYKPGFTYIKSEILQQEVAFSEKTGWLYCEDGVKYSPNELLIIAEAGMVLDVLTHMVKKIIGGEVVKVERPADKGKPVEGAGGGVEPNTTNTNAEIPGAHGVSTQNGDGELDIF
jgi:hypothetical protein